MNNLNKEENKEENKDEKIRIICAIADHEATIPATICQCDECNIDILLCDATIDGMKERFPDKPYSEYKLICSLCYEKDHKITPELILHQFKILTPTQKKLVREQLLLKFGDRVKESIFYKDL